MRAKGFDEDEAVFVMDQAGFDDIDVEKAQRVLGKSLMNSRLLIDRPGQVVMGIQGVKFWSTKWLITFSETIE